MIAGLTLLFDLGLAGLAVWVAWQAVSSGEAFRAVVLFVVLGLLVALVWLRLEAPNVALAEAAVGAGLTGVLLLETLGRLRRAAAVEPPQNRRTRRLRRLGVGIPVAAAGAGLATAALLLDPAPRGVGPEIMARLDEAGAQNPVTAVLLNFRSADTLLEIAVLFLAVAAVHGLTRRRAPDTPLPAPPHSPSQPPEPMLVWFARRLAPLGILVGGYLWWVGATLPGGAFQAGAVLGAVFALLLVTGQTSAPPPQALWSRALVAGGTAAFTALGLVLLGLNGAFLALPAAWAGTLIVGLEAILTASITACLAMLVAGIPETPSPRRRRP